MHCKKLFLKNKKCNYFYNLRQSPNKGYEMYDNEIIEMEDFSFNHYIHHFDEYDNENMTYSEEHGCIEIIDECIKETIEN